MTNAKDLIVRIREYEAQVSYSVRTNKQELPRVKELLSAVETYKLDKEDKDLEVRLLNLRDRIAAIEPDNLDSVELDQIREEANSIRETLTTRYQERLEANASRYSHL